MLLTQAPRIYCAAVITVYFSQNGTLKQKHGNFEANIKYTMKTSLRGSKIKEQKKKNIYMSKVYLQDLAGPVDLEGHAIQ